MFRFHKGYFLLTALLFITEILIALYLHDRFIRPYFGDFLVVILMYCFFKSFLKASVLQITIPVLIFAYIIETLQYFSMVNLLGLQNSELARVVLGSSFEWLDMVAYTLGIILVLLIEKKRTNKLTSSPVKTI